MRKTLLIVAVAVVVIAAGVAYLATRGPGPSVPPLVESCQVRTDTGQVKLNPDQMANAATIAAVGLRRALPEQAVVIALAAALQESALTNVTSGDRDSVGLFQQRPSQGWGSADQLMDPRYAANAFYDKLQRTPNWQSMRITDAAQAVQVSAFPEAYDKWVDESQVLTEGLAGDTPGAVTCNHVGDPPARGQAAATALGQGIQLDWGDSVAVSAADTPMAVSLDPAGDQQVGWRYAHWIVANSQARGVQQVRFADREWTANLGVWTEVVDAPPSAVVLAQVFPA